MDLIDERASLRTKEMQRRPVMSWYNKDTQALLLIIINCEKDMGHSFNNFFYLLV